MPHQQGLQVVARGSSISGLKATLKDAELVSGSPDRVELSFKVPGVARAFDLFGAEAIFRPFVPPGLTMVDVHEENGVGIVDMRAPFTLAQGVRMEALPVILGGAIAFIVANWAIILIGGAVLAAVTAGIVMLAHVVNVVADVIGVSPILLFALGLGGLLLLSMGRRQERGPPRPGTPERRPLVGTVIPPRDVAAQQFGELVDRVLERVVDRFRPELEEKFQELNAPLASEVSSLGRRVAALERDSSCVRKAPAA